MTELEKLLIENEELFENMRQCWLELSVMPPNEANILRVQERVRTFIESTLDARRDAALLSMGCYVMAVDVAAAIEGVISMSIPSMPEGTSCLAEIILDVVRTFRQASGGLIFMDDPQIRLRKLEEEGVISDLLM